MTLEELALCDNTVSTLAILLMKLAVLIVGYLLAKLGYLLLVQGITGQFKFKGEFQGIKADVISASPGTLFIVLSVVLLIIAVRTEKSTSSEVSSPPSSASSIEMPDLPLPLDTKGRQ